MMNDDDDLIVETVESDNDFDGIDEDSMERVEQSLAGISPVIMG